MSDKTHTYEATLWGGDDGWHAKILRNGTYYDHRNGFESREAALEWARGTVRQDKIEVEQERRAERVTL